MKIVFFTARVIGYIALVIVAALMVITTIDVFMRYAFNNPLTGTAELTEIAMVLLLLAVAWCAVEGRHVSIDLVMTRFPQKVQAVVDSINLVMCVGIYSLLVWQGFVRAAINIGHRSTLLRIPEYPVRVLFSLSFAMLVITIIPLIIQKITKVIKG